MAQEKLDIYKLSQQDYHVLEEMILENPKLATTKDDSERLLLHWAALGGRDQLLELLFSRPDAPSVEVADDISATPLILASLKGSLPCVRLLVGRGANVNARNAQGHSALQYACSKGHKDVVEFLLTNGADANIRDARDDTPLHRVAALERPEILRMLLDAPRVEVNAQNKEGNTPLHIACEDSLIPTAIQLIEKGARVDIENKEKQTALDVCKPGLRRQIRTKLGLKDD